MNSGFHRKALSIAIAASISMPTAVQAVKYKLSGQVSRAMVFYDDGEQSDVRNVDNGQSGTRFRLKGSEDLGNGMQVGFYWELQTSSSPSDQARPGQDNDDPQNTNNLRQANVWFSGSWGKLTLGQQDGAGNGTTEVDLSGTDLSGAYHGRTSFPGGMRWRTSSGGCITSTGAPDPSCNNAATGGTFFNEYDGFSRYDSVRYDAPALGPVGLSASVGNDSTWSVAARVGGELAGGQLSAAFFYGQSSGANDSKNRYGGSASYLFSQGTSITGAYSHNESDAGLDSHVFSVKLGQKWGQNAVSVGYGQAFDVMTDGFDDTGFNVGYVHSLPKASTQLYASYFFQSLDVPAGVSDVKDHNAVVVGARVQFD